ncbi:hypothetical protein PFLUV_G00048870 [Perca fluviatilis]|uniref:Uncharacterized protein n=1 Tax=Perca fluviatilis TaxID=8168 RepID=A0A6A5ERL7_PERFL|nr:hypothetical protein PFLUV_G00048870 [Perca fluviatilis]
MQKHQATVHTYKINDLCPLFVLSAKTLIQLKTCPNVSKSLEADYIFSFVESKLPEGAVYAQHYAYIEGWMIQPKHLNVFKHGGDSQFNKCFSYNKQQEQNRARVCGLLVFNRGSGTPRGSSESMQ